MERIRLVAGAALVLALLVLPPALSAGQEASTDVPPAASESQQPPGPPAPPAGGGSSEGGDSSGGSGPSGGQSASPGDGAGADGAGAEAAAVDRGTTNGAGGSSERLARAAASLTVSVGDNFYAPRSVSIDVGDTVTWTNNGQAPHSATANNGSFDTGVFNPGQSRSHTFSQAGTFNYFCTVHAGQTGTVTVASTGGGGGGGGGSDGPSEAEAVASADAAGSGTALPSTGSDVLPPLIVGLLLLTAGGMLRLRDLLGPA